MFNQYCLYEIKEALLFPYLTLESPGECVRSTVASGLNPTSFWTFDFAYTKVLACCHMFSSSCTQSFSRQTSGCWQTLCDLKIVSELEISCLARSVSAEVYHCLARDSNKDSYVFANPFGLPITEDTSPTKWLMSRLYCLFVVAIMSESGLRSSSYSRCCSSSFKHNEVTSWLMISRLWTQNLLLLSRKYRNLNVTRGGALSGEIHIWVSLADCALTPVITTRISFGSRFLLPHPHTPI